MAEKREADQVRGSNNIAQNTFNEGLSLDTSKFNTKSQVMSDALNASLVQSGEEEFVLQTEGGNIKIAELIGEEFVPIGVKEHDGIAYIISVKRFIEENEDKSLLQIGTYPSPDYKTGKIVNEYSPLKNYLSPEQGIRKRGSATATNPDVSGGTGFTIPDVPPAVYSLNFSDIKYTEDDSNLTSISLKVRHGSRIVAEIASTDEFSFIDELSNLTEIDLTDSNNNRDLEFSFTILANVGNFDSRKLNFRYELAFIPEELDDFITNQIYFDSYNPVEIEIQESYDGTVNIIFANEDIEPRIVNSRFTKNKNSYEIIDRRNENDTNIYTQSDVEELTSFFRNSSKIPDLQFNGIQEGGQLPSGNYRYYFRYLDADFNPSNIVEESSNVAVFAGNSVKTAYPSDNSEKSVSFTLGNLDRTFAFVEVFYVYSLNELEAVEQSYKIDFRYPITDNQIEITHTGFEDTIVNDINSLSAPTSRIERFKTMCQIQGRLFVANTNANTTSNDRLKDFASRIVPEPKVEYLDVYTADLTGNAPISSFTSTEPDIDFNEPIGDTTILDNILQDEFDDKNGAFYNPNNIYYRTGYWPGETYVTGIVYIDKKTGTETQPYSLASTFGVPGALTFPDTDSSEIVNESGVTKVKNYGILFRMPDISEIKDLISGYYFVRQKRRPNILAQGFMNSTIPSAKISFNGRIAYDNENEIKDLSDNNLKFTPTIGGMVPTMNFGNTNAEMVPVFAPPEICPIIEENEVKPRFAVHSIDFLSRSNIQNSIYNNKSLVVKVRGQLTPGITGVYNKYSQGYNNFGFEALKAEFDGNNVYVWIPNLIFPVLTKGYFGSNITIKGKSDWVLPFSSIYNQVLGSSSPIINNVFASDFIEETNPFASYYDALRNNGPQAAMDIEKTYIRGFPSADEVIYITKGSSSDDLQFVGQYHGYLIFEQGEVEGAFLRGNLIEQSASGSNVNFYTPFGISSEDVSVGTPLFARFLFDRNFNDLRLRNFEKSDPYAGENISEGISNSNKITSVSDRFGFMGHLVDIYSEGGKWDLQTKRKVHSNFSSRPFFQIGKRIQLEQNKSEHTIFDGDCYHTFAIQPHSTSNTPPSGDELTIENESKSYSSWSINMLLVHRCNKNPVFRKEEEELNTAFNINPPVFPYSLSGSSNGEILQSLNDPKFRIEHSENALEIATDNPKLTFATDPNAPFINQSFTNRVYFSLNDVQEEFQNNYRIFRGLNFADYAPHLGEITKLINYQNKLLIVLERGIIITPVKERVETARDTAGAIFIEGAGVLREFYSSISEEFGSQHQFAVVVTPNGIYGYDLEDSVIWTIGEGIQDIGKFNIQSFLNTIEQRNQRPLYEDIRLYYQKGVGNLFLTGYQTSEEGEGQIISYEKQITKEGFVNEQGQIVNTRNVNRPGFLYKTPQVGDPVFQPITPDTYFVVIYDTSGSLNSSIRQSIKDDLMDPFANELVQTNNLPDTWKDNYYVSLNLSIERWLQWPIDAINEIVSDDSKETPPKKMFLVAVTDESTIYLPDQTIDNTGKVNYLAEEPVSQYKKDYQEFRYAYENYFEFFKGLMYMIPGTTPDNQLLQMQLHAMSAIDGQLTVDKFTPEKETKIGNPGQYTLSAIYQDSSPYVPANLHDQSRIDVSGSKDWEPNEGYIPTGSSFLKDYGWSERHDFDDDDFASGIPDGLYSNFSETARNALLKNINVEPGWYPIETKDSIRRIVNPFNIKYNEIIKKWTSRYSFKSNMMFSIGNRFYSFPFENTLWEHIDGSWCRYYDEQHFFEFEFVINEAVSTEKILDNLQIISNDQVPFEIEYETDEGTTVQVISDIYKNGIVKGNARQREESLWVEAPFSQPLEIFEDVIEFDSAKGFILLPEDYDLERFTSIPVYKVPVNADISYEFGFDPGYEDVAPLSNNTGFYHMFGVFELVPESIETMRNTDNVLFDEETESLVVRSLDSSFGEVKFTPFYFVNDFPNANIPFELEQDKKRSELPNTITGDIFSVTTPHFVFASQVTHNSGTQDLPLPTSQEENENPLRYEKIKGLNNVLSSRTSTNTGGLRDGKITVKYGVPTQGRRRLRDKYFKIRVRFRGEDFTQVFSILSKYRISRA